MEPTGLGFYGNAVELTAAIESGDVEPPTEPMSWPVFQSWRAGDGRRPTRARGAARETWTTTGDEVQVWKQLMSSLFGPDWKGDVATNAGMRTPGSSVFGAESLGLQVAGRPAASSAAGSAPAGSSVNMGPPAFTAKVPKSSAEGSAGSHASGGSPPTPAELMDKLAEHYDESNGESVAVYRARMDRIVTALEFVGYELGVKEQCEVYLRVQTAGLDRKDCLKYLKGLFAETLVGEPDPNDSGLRDARFETLTEWLTVRGVTVSNKLEKLFSPATTVPSPSLTPERLAEQQRAIAAAAASSSARQNLSFTPAAPVARSGPSGVAPTANKRLWEETFQYETPRQKGVEEDACSSSPNKELADAIREQTTTIAKILGTKSESEHRLGSTIRISPQITWPKLGDDGPDSRDVEEFFERFDEICSLANDGRGMADKERLKVLLQCLRGSREKTYRVLHRKHRKLGDVDSDPKMVFNVIKARLMRFVETPIEKQMRVLQEFENLSKGKLTALQFEPQWEECVSELETVGLGRNERELMLNYLSKVGSLLASEIQRDMRAWPDGNGQLVVRRVATWEECHMVAMELESLKLNNKSLTSFAYDGGGRPGKGSGKDKPTGLSGAEQGKKICFEMRDSGSCKHGNDCRFSHDAGDIAKAKKEAKSNQQQSQQPAASKDAAVNAQKGGKGKGKGKGKSKDKTKQSAATSGAEVKRDDSRLCGYVKKGETCPYGKDCKFSHQKKRFTPEGKLKQTATQNTKAAEAGASSSGSGDGWGQPVGLGKSTGCVKLLVDADQPTLRIASQQPIQAAIKPDQDGGLKSLSALPKEWWTETPSDSGGYQYQTDFTVMGQRLRVLLDGCAGVNSICEETVLSMLNKARQQGIRADSAEFPVVQLERWVKQEQVTGVRKDAPIKVLGAVVLRVGLLRVNEKPGPQILVRAKIFEKGACEFTGLILGGRALDCEANGGLGFRPMQHGHLFESLGVIVPRMERVESRPDRAYAFHLQLEPSAVDSDEEAPAEEQLPSVFSVQQAATAEGEFDLLLYDGEPLVLEPDEGALVPVVRSKVGQKPVGRAFSEAVLQVGNSLGLDVVPGLWEAGSDSGMILVTNLSALDIEVDRGLPIAGVAEVLAQTRVCLSCKQPDTDAWELGGSEARCKCCDNVLAGGASACRGCGGFTKAFYYSGCQECGFEAKPDEEVVSCGSVYHIVEERGAIDRICEVLSPTESYYEELQADMLKRHPKASVFVIDHLVSLEAFLDRSIVSGFSYGIDKAQLLVTAGKLLGHIVSRRGLEADGSRVEAIMDFAPLKEKLHIQQFLGSTNWLRQYLDQAYSTCVKTLGEFMKPGAEFPPGGLGPGEDRGSLAVRAIKIMCRDRINLETIDEAAAIDGSRPLEQVADCSGIGWGGTGLQMRSDLSGFKVLYTAGKGLTPAQQAWPPLTLEAYAQLETKRTQRAVLGPMRSVCWTDHANLTKQQTSEHIDVKHLRWIAEITADGSCLRSLSGRAAKLGDGISRNPIDRDDILAQRSKDLAGLCGQLRGFSLEEYLSEHEHPGIAVPWTVPGHAVPDKVESEKSVAAIASEAGVTPVVRILYVSDYVPTNVRVALTGNLWRQMSAILPNYLVSLAISEGPFEDDDGQAFAHFDGKAQNWKHPSKQVLETKKDLLTSVVKVLRSCIVHKPHIIIGDGQGGLVCLALAKPLLIEAALAARNVQRDEADAAGKAWGGVLTVVVRQPRLGKAKSGVELFKLAAPEVFVKFPEPSIHVVAVHHRTDALYDDAAVLYKAIEEIDIVTDVKGVVWQQLIEGKRPRVMWSHSGRCSCGKRTYLFGACSTCIQNEAKVRHEEATEQAEKLDERVPLQEEMLYEDKAVYAQKPLFETVGTPPVEILGSTTRVQFVTDNWIKSIARTASADNKNEGWVQSWEKGKRLVLPSAPSAPFRLTCAWDREGDEVLLVQQCVCVKFEECHEVSPAAWTKSVADLPFARDWVAVREALNKVWKTKPALKPGQLVSAPRSLVDQLRKPLIGCFKVELVRLVRGVFPKQEKFQKCTEHGTSICIAYHSKGGWDIVSLSNLQKAGPDDWHWLIEGSCRKEQVRKVVSVFSDKWMFYDPDGELATAARGLIAAKKSSLPVKAEEPVEADEEEEDAFVRASNRFWGDATRRRARLTEEARGEAGVPEVDIGDSLRVTWMVAQRADVSLAPLLKRKWSPNDEYRIAEDGLLEKKVKPKSPALPENYVPVVPDGQAAVHLSWKKWVFLQVHAGVFGAHRGAEQTVLLLERICVWEGMRAAVPEWCNQCLTCIRFRKRPTKTEAIAVKPTHLECWEEVMIDCEGPSNPPDSTGHHYILSYLCLLSHGVLLEPIKQLTFSEVRRAFARCVFRSGTLPLMVRSDRGPEFRNHLIREFMCLVGIRQRFGTPWRPVEQAPVERVHQEVQKSLGILFHDIVRCFPEEWTELLPVLEFVLYNTPGPHGLTPRDIDRRWSLALPLEKELVAFEVATAFEPISEYAKSQFKAYREVREIVLRHYAKTSEQRAALANRFRRSRTLEPGMSVAYRDPRLARKGAEGCRTPWKTPLCGPCIVLGVQGNHVRVQRNDGTEILLHIEDVVTVPPSAEKLEEKELELKTAGDGERRSIGEMLEAKDAKKADVKDESGQKGKKPVGAGKLEKLSVGTYVAYSQGAQPKKLRIGKITVITRNEATVTVQRYRPLSDGRLRVKWVPVENRDAYGSAVPMMETLNVRQVMTTVQLHDGVISHAAARKLDRSGWSLDESDLQEQADVEAVAEEGNSGGVEAMPRVDWYKRLEQFVFQLKGRTPEVEEFEGQTGVVFANQSIRQQWLAEGHVDFLEIFCGCQELTFRIREAGLKAAEGLDSKLVSYGQVWPLHLESTRQEAAWLVCHGLRPLAVHTGTPCTHLCAIGLRDHLDHAESPLLLDFSAMIAEHQETYGLFCSNETPGTSSLPLQERWVQVCGPLNWPKGRWRYTRSDGCQHHVVYPGVDDEGRPMQKAKLWTTNFDVRELNLRCRRPGEALAGSSHEHRVIRGGAKLPTGHWVSVASFSGRYTAEECTVYSRCLCRALRTEKPQRSSSARGTALEKLARQEIASVSAQVGQGEVCEPVLDGKPKEVTEQEKEAFVAEVKWQQLAEAKNWNSVRADLSVYRFCGETIREDPRLTEAYKDRVVEGVGFAAGTQREELSEHDMVAAREVLRRKAAAFWLEGAPRTTIVGVQHDTVPTGPPCKTPPHALKGESAAWIDEQLQKEVQRGQLELGNSPWGSPPFPTKEFAVHRKQRKRRMVIDYRRVNARTLRAVYYLRKSSDVLAQAAGSLFMSMLDAVTGFNLLINTSRARQMLAIVSRSGQYLPRCLTFGPVNGPEDFGFVVDRVFGGHSGRASTVEPRSVDSRQGQVDVDGEQSVRLKASPRFCREWLAYVDDLTVRTGRYVDGQCMSDDEANLRIKRAVKSANSNPESKPFQTTAEAFRALGFAEEDTRELGREFGGTQKRQRGAEVPAAEQQQPPKQHRQGAIGLGSAYSSDPSPFAHPKEQSSSSKYRPRSRSPRRGRQQQQQQQDQRSGQQFQDPAYVLSRGITNVVRHGKGSLPARADGFYIVASVVEVVNSGRSGWGSAGGTYTVEDVIANVNSQKKPRFQLSEVPIALEGDAVEMFRDSVVPPSILCIRALQGHSAAVPVEDELLYEKFEFPAEGEVIFYHGTQEANTASIWLEGLKPGGGMQDRRHVMMATSYNRPSTAGIRSGSTAVVKIDGRKIAGQVWRSKGGAIVADFVDAEALTEIFRLEPKTLTKVCTLKWRIPLSAVVASSKEQARPVQARPVPGAEPEARPAMPDPTVQRAVQKARPAWPAALRAKALEQAKELVTPPATIVLNDEKPTKESSSGSVDDEWPSKVRAPSSPERELNRRAERWQADSDSDADLVDLEWPAGPIELVQLPPEGSIEKDDRGRLLWKVNKKLEVQLRAEQSEADAKEEGWECDNCGGSNLRHRRVCYQCSTPCPPGYGPDADGVPDRPQSKRKRGGKKHRKRIRRIRDVRRFSRLGLGRQYCSDPSPFAHLELVVAHPAGAGTLFGVAAASAWLAYDFANRVGDVAVGFVDAASDVAISFGLEVVVVVKQTGRAIRRAVAKAVQSLTYCCYLFFMFEGLRLVVRIFEATRIGLSRHYSSDPSPYAQPQLSGGMMKQKESLAVLQESAEAGRLSRGCLLVESVKALADGNGCSVSGYEIKLHGPTEQLRCTCADFIYRGLQCKHILATKMWLNGLPSSASGVESAAPPAPATSRPVTSVFNRPVAVEEVPAPVPKSSAIARAKSLSVPGGEQVVRRRVEFVPTTQRPAHLPPAVDEKPCDQSVRVETSAVRSSWCFDGLREKALQLRSKPVAAQEVPGQTFVQVPSAVPVPMPVPARRSSSVSRSRSSASAVAERTGTSVVLEQKSGLAEDNIGTCCSILTSVTSQEEAVRLLKTVSGGAKVLLCGFSFDRQDVTEGLIEARLKGCEVSVVLDRSMTLTGRTRDQLSQSKKLVSSGVRVKLAVGETLDVHYRAAGRSVAGHLAGIQHSKVLCVVDEGAKGIGSYLLLGSTNWTTSSRGNHELNALIKIRPELAETVYDLAAVPFVKGTDLSEAGIADAQRARSVSPSRYNR